MTMSTRVITIHDYCIKCNRVLHSIAEGERGTCSSCWVASLKPETKKAMNRLIACVFNKSTEEEKQKAVDDAIEQLNKETNELANKKS